MKIKTLIFSFVFLFLLASCGLETKQLNDFYKKDLDDVTMIVILDGRTGNKKTIMDKKLISDFLSEIRDIQFIPEKNQEQRKGFQYSVILFQNDVETFKFELTQVNGIYYYTKPDIYPIVDDFYKRIDVRD
ncbi:hypothetical protein [Bacillus sp. 165]|uniref:hypothetical protein n=1 Tax=Bacillus sp. 165 TaxID=1529117 RepID=UPI001ADA855A|nr:hypothetical protein [Bacillus sp. 165]MBO9129527.1 hypothetical protein [Bacillus sp. 165]